MAKHRKQVGSRQTLRILMFLLCIPHSLGALQCSTKDHPAFLSSRISLGTAQTLQESRYFCAVSSTDQKCIKCTKVANHCVISTVSSKPYGKNGIELQQTRTSQSFSLVQSRACLCNQPLALSQLCLPIPKAKPGALLPSYLTTSGTAPSFFPQSI